LILKPPALVVMIMAAGKSPEVRLKWALTDSARISLPVSTESKRSKKTGKPFTKVCRPLA